MSLHIGPGQRTSEGRPQALKYFCRHASGTRNMPQVVSVPSKGRTARQVNIAAAVLTPQHNSGDMSVSEEVG